MNDYEQRQEARRERYKQQATKARQESQQRYAQATEIAHCRPFGQPILVGHHSERSARADQRRIDTNMRKGIEASDRADYYAGKAATVGRGGVSSDDPDAVNKLCDRLLELKANHERMKLINRLHKAFAKDQAKGERLMEKHTLTETDRRHIRSYEPAYSWEPHPYPPYALQNSLGNIKRIEKRIARLDANATRVTKSYQIGSVEIIENAEENRVQLLFPDEPPADVRERLKRNGFRWSRLFGAWQRQLNPYAVILAQEIAQAFADDSNTA